MALDDLPAELIGAICDFCSTPEIKSIRLACRFLRNVADKYLISEVELSMNRNSLEACNGIAAHPVFSNTARRLWIDAERPTEMTFRDWEQERKRQIRHNERLRELAISRGEQPDSGPESLAELQRGKTVLSEDQLWVDYAREARLAYESERMLHDQSLFNTLRNLLSCCPKIGRLTLSARTKCQQYFDQHTGVDAMAQLVLAAAAANFKPRELYLEDISHGIFAREDIVEKALDFFRDIKQLKWDFFRPSLDRASAEIDEQRWDVLTHFHNGNFARLIQAAACVQSLHVSLPECFSLSILGGSYQWQQLLHIHLDSIVTWHTQLVGLLLDHRATLQSVWLEEMWLEDGSWSECFACIAGKLPRLTEFELHGLYSEAQGDGTDRWTTFYDFGDGTTDPNPDQYARMISEYLINGGGEFPPNPKEIQQSGNDATD